MIVHAPGPWRPTEGGHVVDASGSAVAAVWGAELEANARLIAAAPELLAVVARTADQRCLCAATYSDVPEAWDPAGDCPACAARALIRRLGGGR